MEKLIEGEVKPEQVQVQESFTLKHNGKLSEVGRDELIVLAQKGLDYDRIRRDRDECRQKLANLEQLVGENEGAMLSDEVAAGVVQTMAKEDEAITMQPDGFGRLLQMYPEVQKYESFEALPEGFIAELAQGRSPVEAWQMYLLDRQKLQMAMLERKNRNKQAAAPDVRSMGRYDEDGFVKALFGK